MQVRIGLFKYKFDFGFRMLNVGFVTIRIKSNCIVQKKRPGATETLFNIYNEEIF